MHEAHCWLAMFSWLFSAPSSGKWLAVPTAAHASLCLPPSLPPLALRRSVLPPTTVRLALRSPGGSRSQLDQLGSAADREVATTQPLDDDASSTAGLSDISTAAATTPGERRHRQQPATPPQAHRPAPTDGATGAAAGGGGGGGGGSGKKKRSSWWRRLYRPKHLQWQDYRIGEGVVR